MLTVDQCRDKLAEMEGWEKVPVWSSVTPHPWLHKDGRTSKDHPIPATLDAAAAALPEGWGWLKNERYWIGVPPSNNGGNCVMTLNTGDEIADHFNLALLAREKGATHAK